MTHGKESRAYLPEQVAEILVQGEGRLDAPQGADLASMDLATMERALRIALTATANGTLPPTA
jgi:hypothetical protein